MTSESMSIEEARRIVRTAAEASAALPGLKAAEKAAQATAYEAELAKEAKAEERRKVAYSVAGKVDVAEKTGRGMCCEEKEWEEAFAAWGAAFATWEASAAALPVLIDADEKRWEALRNWKAVKKTMDAEWWNGGLLAHAQRIVAAADDRRVLRQIVGLNPDAEDTADEVPVRRRTM